MKQLEIFECKEALDRDKITQAEHVLGFKLPSAYKEFLLNNNGGHPIKDSCPLLESFYGRVENKETDIAWFSAIHGGRYNNLVKQYISFKGGYRIPDEFLTIACNSGGDEICLCISGANYGKVYFWNHENQNPTIDNAWYKNIHLVANSFEDFINSLYHTDFETNPTTGKKIKWLYTHDRYSLPHSTHAKEYGEKITGFFAQAPAEVEDFVIEEIEANGDIVLYYDVKSEGKKYIREMDKEGNILSERIENTARQ